MAALDAKGCAWVSLTGIGIEMFKLWKASTIAAVIIAAAAGAAYAAGGDLTSPMVAGVLAALAVFVVALGTSGYVAATSTAVTAASSLVVFALFRQTTLTYGRISSFEIITPLAIGVVATLVLAVVNAKEDGAEESYLELVLAALPFGIGTVLGGLAMAIRHFGTGETGGHHAAHHAAG